MVTVDAGAMGKGIDAEGRIAIHCIPFDTDSERIKPDSRPALEEIVKFLNSRPGLKLLVAGHTNNAGRIQYNMDLSNRRAGAEPVGGTGRTVTRIRRLWRAGPRRER